LGLFILLHDPRAKFAQIFAVMSFFICVWTFVNYATNSYAGNLHLNDVANKLAYVSGYGVVFFGLLFTYYFPIRRKFSRLEIIILTITSLSLAILSCTSLVSGEVILLNDGTLQFSIGPLISVYIYGFLILIVLIAKNLIKASRDLDHDHKMQANLVSVAFCISAFGGLFLNVLIPLALNNWSLTMFGPLTTIVLVVVIVYAIIRHGLFDIRLALVRTFAYVLSLTVFVVGYYLLAYLLSILVLGSSTFFNEQNGLSIVIALVLASFFQPVKRLFDRLTNAIFYKDNYNSDEFFARINRIATQTTDLYDLIRSSSGEIEKTIKLEQVVFAIINEQKTFSIGTGHHIRMPHSDVLKLKDFISSDSYRIVEDGFIGSATLDHQTKRLLISHKLELIIPLTVSKKIVGILCLGDKKSGRYTSRDINVLKTVSDELSIAIQNALAIQEIRDLNDSLQQKISNATKELRASNAQLQRLDKAKDEFVSMASHQLRTPLTTVKGYISMVVEGDAGEITSEQRRLLDEAFMSSERMVNLINDFLNVSRIQTGKFLIDKHETNLGELVKQEIDRLKSNADSRKLEFIYKKPKDFPIMNIDEAKIREVVMNFADNALYYSHEGAKIDVKLHVDENNQAIFEIIDTGIGVSLEDQSRLFTKFYRASNAKRQRPDGTGVGLFLAKKVISAHGGKVLFSSVEGKGSTFGFSLPVE
jgi:signal transduction histidine kinase